MTDRHDLERWAQALANADARAGRAAAAARLLEALGEEGVEPALVTEFGAPLEPRDVEAALALALEDLEARIAPLQAVADDPFFADEAESHGDALVALLEARDRLEHVVAGARRAGRAADARNEGFDARLREVLDRTLPANEARRSAAPTVGGWWWTYRLACDEAALVRLTTGQATAEDRTFLDEHLPACEGCRRDLAETSEAESRLDRDASGIALVCPGEDELLRFSRGELTPALGRAIDVHAALCERCRTTLRRSIPRRRERSPLVKFRSWAHRRSQAEVVAFDEDDPLAPLEPLRTLARLAGDLEQGEGVEVGVVQRDGAPRLLVLAPGLERAHLFAAGEHGVPPEPLMVAYLRDGFLDLDLRGHLDRALLVRLGEDRPVVSMHPEVVHTRPEPEDEDVTLACTALGLGNAVLAVQLLDGYARRLPPGLKRRLALEAADALFSRLDPDRAAGLLRTDARPDAQPRGTPPSAVPGLVRTLVAWRGHGGVVEVVAPFREWLAGESATGELAKVLAQAGRFGLDQAWRVRHGAALSAASDVSFPAPSLRCDLEAGLEARGSSVGLAAALAAYSRQLDLPAPPVLVTGELDPATGEVKAVQARTVEEKLRAAVREHPGRDVLLPAGNQRHVPALAEAQARLAFVATFAEAADRVFGPSHRTNLGAAPGQRLLDDAFVLERAYDREGALGKTREFLTQHGPSAKPDDLLRAHWIAGACLVHLARPEEAVEELEAARQLLSRVDPEGVDSDNCVFLALAEADRLADTFEIDRGLAVLEEARAWASSGPLRAKVHGFRGLLLHYAGRHDEALQALERAVDLAGDRLDAARFGCWRALACTALGQEHDAHAAIEEGLALARAVDHGAARFHEAYLERALARLELACHRPAAALAAADRGLALLACVVPRAQPYPCSSLHHLRGRALLMQGPLEPALAALEAVRPIVGSAKSPFGRLVAGLALIERAAVFEEHDAPASTREAAHAEARELVAGYLPAARRFVRELGMLPERGRRASESERRILGALPY